MQENFNEDDEARITLGKSYRWTTFILYFSNSLL